MSMKCNWPESQYGRGRDSHTKYIPKVCNRHVTVIYQGPRSWQVHAFCKGHLKSYEVVNGPHDDGWIKYSLEDWEVFEVMSK